MPQAVRYARFGKAAEVAELVDVPEAGPPGAGEVVIAVEASPINPADLLQFEGRYGAEPPQLPVWAGGEGVGIVKQVGPDVTHLKIGDRVLLLFAGRGNWRHELKAKAAKLFPLPPADPLQLAMVTVNPPTALLMLTQFVEPKPGAWVVQNAGNSAVGHNVIVLAKQLGLRTLSVVRRANLEPGLKKLGADSVLVDGPDLADRILAVTGKSDRPRLAIDAVAGNATQRLGKAVTEGGVIVNYGMLSGSPCEVDPGDVVFRDVTLRGFWLAKWFATARPDEIQATYAKLIGMIASGALHVDVEAAYPLARIREALAHAAREARMGKILITPMAGA